MSSRVRDSRVLALSDVYKFFPPPPLTLPFFLSSLSLFSVALSSLLRSATTNFWPEHEGVKNRDVTIFDLHGVHLRVSMPFTIWSTNFFIGRVVF